MSSSTQIKLSQTSRGRVRLHLQSLIQDKNVKWHWKGILREIEGLKVELGIVN